MASNDTAPALNTDGSLKDASEIIWIYSPSQEATLGSSRSIDPPSPTPLPTEPVSGHSGISNTLIDSLKKNTTIKAKPAQRVCSELNLSAPNSTAKSGQHVHPRMNIGS
ncbi:hypothetical protein OBBRIDRAFT_798481 [Obba rivulosa]|uniref:Uncharacterized protein n=1 Tax=Obba rivulosa TaxID=1052685 RepID=A0A8E2DEQ7_9APHY|nr:hypothetical protein OBBRIDRAFT_798481 [Obba rivulosa]